MEALKSYFNKFVPQGNVSRKGSAKWKKAMNREKGIPSGMPHRSASTSHVDLDSRDADLGAITMSTVRTFSPTVETFRLHHRASEPHCSSTDAMLKCRRDITRTPPPSKPPRKDLVFSVQFDTEGLNDIGLEIDCVPSSANSSPCSKSKGSYSSFPMNCVDGDETKDHLQNAAEQSDRFCTAAHSDKSCSAVTKDHSSTVKVVALTQGSRCNMDGRVKINDEIVEINGDPLCRESRESVRLLLENAIKSGHVVLTIRRRRNRAVLLPSVPAAKKSIQECNHKSRSASTDGLRSNELNCVSSYTCSVLPEPVHLEDLNVDINISSDDVFADSTTPSDKVTYVNLPHIRFQNNKHVVSNGTLHHGIDPAHDSLQPIGSSHSASEGTFVSTTKIDDCSRQEYFLPRDNTFRQGSSTSTLVEETDNKTGSDPNSIISSVESIGNLNTHEGIRLAESTSINSTPSRKFLEKIYNRQVDNCHTNRGENVNIMSMSTIEYEPGAPSSPSPSTKKRVISKLNLLKDDNGLGIHIAGGKGCKKGDIGIFVAAITEGGAADKASLG